MPANRSCSDYREACKKWGGMGLTSFGCPRAVREGKGGGVKSMVAQTHHFSWWTDGLGRVNTKIVTLLSVVVI
jgi:hypothetical protein